MNSLVTCFFQQSPTNCQACTFLLGSHTETLLKWEMASFVADISESFPRWQIKKCVVSVNSKLGLTLGFEVKRQGLFI